MKKLEVLNTGAWPKEVWYCEIMLAHWATRWTVHRIQCYAEGYVLLGEFPKWALTQRQQEQIDAAAKALLK